MIPTTIIVSLAFLWLGYETKWLTVNLMEVYIMRLPSGALITEQDLNFLEDLLKPKKNKGISNGACWYCNNGHDRQRIDLGNLSYDICECGASICELAKKNGRKLPYAKLGAEFARAIGAPKRNPKAMM